MHGKPETYRGYTITPRTDKGYDISHIEKHGIVYRYTKQQCYAYINGLCRGEYAWLD